MWKRFTDTLRCPCCQGKLELTAIEEHDAALSDEDYKKGEELGIKPEDLNTYIDAGVLLSGECKHWYPIIYGLPVLLPFETPITNEFKEKYKFVLGKITDG